MKESRDRFLGRCRANPERTRIRLIVRSEGTSMTGQSQDRSGFNNSNRIRREPHRGCLRRMSTTAASTSAET